MIRVVVIMEPIHAAGRKKKPCPPSCNMDSLRPDALVLFFNIFYTMDTNQVAVRVLVSPPVSTKPKLSSIHSSEGLPPLFPFALPTCRSNCFPVKCFFAM